MWRMAPAGGFSTTSGYTGSNTSLLAIVEGRGQARGEIGMASLDMNLAKLVICQFNDSQNYTKVVAKLNVFSPAQILMPSTMCDIAGQQPSRLFLHLEKEFPTIPLTPIQRKVFNEATGLQQLHHITLPEYESVVYTVSQKYYGLAAVAALLKYVEVMKNTIFPMKALKVEFQLSEQTVMIDHATSQHLELLQNNLVSNSCHSLLGVINNCKTPGGARCLRTNILQPPCDMEVINRRLNCIQELRNNPMMHYELMNALSQLPQDLEHVIATLIHIPKLETTRIVEQRINYIIFLKQTLACLPTFANVLAHCHHLFFHSARQEFLNPTFEKILGRIRDVINEDARFHKGASAMRMQRCFAINAGINPLLDIARKALVEIQEDTTKYVADLSVEHQINFRLLENCSRGFYIQFLIPGRVWDLPALPPTFLNVVTKKNIVTFTTEVLLLAEQRMTKILEEIQNITNLIVSEVCTDIRQDIGYLYKVSDAISELDILYALTTYSMSSMTMARPEFSNNFTAISMGRHPILDSISNPPATPNNFFMSGDTNVALITGPNMSGKTTLLKQIATLQILAQIGSFVPADAATFRLVTQIFSRIGNGDKIEDDASSFKVEMREMNYILSNMDSRSLVIIDELGRSTSIEEGAAICWAMIETLMQLKGFVLFATHYLFLAKMESLYLNVLNYKLDTPETFEMEEEDGLEEAVPGTPIGNQSFTQQVVRARLNYTHVLKRGVTDVENYGLKLAKNSSYPPAVLKRAMSIAKEIRESRQASVATEHRLETKSKSKAFPQQRAHYLLASHLYLLSGTGIRSKRSRLEIANYLHTLQDQFIVTNY